jgi:hypothetical protein
MRGYDAGSWLGVAGACCESHLAGFLMSLSFFPPSALLLHLSFSSHLCDELCSAFVTNRDAIESCAPRSIHEQSEALGSFRRIYRPTYRVVRPTCPVGLSVIVVGSSDIVGSYP